MKNANRARLMRPRVPAGFAADSLAGVCVGFLAGSTMLLQGNFVKVFIKIKVLKLPEVKSMCTYGVTLPGEHLQVAMVVAEVVSPHLATRASVLGQSSAGLLRHPSTSHHPSTSSADFATVTSVSLQRKSYQ